MRRRLWFRQRSWTSVGAQLAIAASLVDALPLVLEPRQSEHMQDSTNRRNDPQDLDNDISPRVWVPAVGVVIFIFCVFFFIYTRTSVLSRMRSAIVRARQSSNNTSTSQGNLTGSGTREVTAQQLTGVGRNATIVNTSRNRSNNNAGVGRTNPRTGRRNRRTPSQMSTHSLPVYMKEPGDQELVIFTGPEAVDVDVSIAEAREAEDRDDGRYSDSLRREETRDSEVVPDAVVRESGGGEPLGPGPRPDQSAMSLGLTDVGVGAEREHDPDTSTTQLLSQRSSFRLENDDSQQRRDSGISNDTADERSSLMQRRASLVPSEAPPDYEVGDTADNNAQDRHLARVRESLSTASHGIDPPGLSEQVQSPSSMDPASNESYPPSYSSPIHPSSSPSPLPSPRSSRLLGAGDRRSRLASRVSQFLHLRNAANVNSTSTAFPVTEGESGGRSSDAVVEPGSGLPLVSGSRTNSRMSNSISLNDLSSDPSAQQGQGSGQRTQQRQSHRQSNSSVSTSAFHLPLRTLSRPRSSNTLSSAFGSRSNINLHSHSHTNSIPNTNANADPNSTTLTSPSTLSLGQSILAGQTTISAPLPHTLVRTEIRYPAGGPTPEQLKLLSSRDVLGRFAVPYGESAVEFARSSRLEVGAVDEEPPPVFDGEGEGEGGENGEERDGDGRGDGRGQEEGGSRRRNTGSSNVGEGTRERERRSEDMDGSNGDDPDGLPAHSNTNTNTNTDSITPPTPTPPQTHRRNRSVENVPVIEPRILLPLFL